MFKLDQKLQADTFFVHDFKISQLLLMNNANYPWFILVPRQHNLVELTDLDFANQTEVLREINVVSKILQKEFKPTKLNIAALGTMVRQCHIHIIARFENDLSFPNPVWGGTIKSYEEKNVLELIKKIKSYL